MVTPAKYQGLQARQIVISNAITRAAQGITLVEKRILFSALGKMQGEFDEIQISAQEYSDTFEIDIDTAYLQLKNSIRNFRKRYIALAEKNRTGESNWEINWVSYIRYSDQMAYVTIKFNPDIAPFLFNLQSQFTKYQLKQACALRSIYSWRMLEIFEQMRSSTERVKDKNGWLIISLEEFIHAMQIPKSYQSNFGVIRQKVIEPAIEELTHKDNWVIEFEPIKKGRKVVSLKFNYEQVLQQLSLI